jgi:hypothetical protein
MVTRVENYLGISDDDITYGTRAIETWWWEKPEKEDLKKGEVAECEEGS